LLFGPPGTSKTSIAKAISERLGWPLVVITPSEFLSKGLEQIYVRVDEIFKDLMDISGAVILFDAVNPSGILSYFSACRSTTIMTYFVLPRVGPASLSDRSHSLYPPTVVTEG
jgi:AAA+ superfamily predicted ATPase